MKLDELRTVQSKERRKDSLQQLRDSFYEDVAAFLQDLKARRDRRAEQVDDPFSDAEVRRMSDELETAEEVAEAVYERRVGKVVKLASFAAADMPVDDDGMTSEERELFNDLVGRISQNKQSVLNVLSGNNGATTPDATANESTDSPSSPNPPPSGTAETATEPNPQSGSESTAAETTTESASDDSLLADAMAPTDESASTTEPDSVTTAVAEAVAGPTESHDTDTEPASGEPTAEGPPPEPVPDAAVETTTDGGTAATRTPATSDSSSPTTAEPTDDGADRTTLRITKNVGEIFGVDGREYTLRSEDVVTLPTTNAEPLIERDAALQLE